MKKIFLICSLFLMLFSFTGCFNSNVNYVGWVIEGEVYRDCRNIFNPTNALIDFNFKYGKDYKIISYTYDTGYIIVERRK